MNDANETPKVERFEDTREETGFVTTVRLPFVEMPKFMRAMMGF